MFDLKGFVSQCTRVWKLLKRPSKVEFWTISKVSAIGLGIVGIIGFAISMMIKLMFFKA